MRRVYIKANLVIHPDKVDPKVREEAEKSMKALSRAYEIARNWAFSRVSVIVPDPLEPDVMDVFIARNVSFTSIDNDADGEDFDT